MPSCEVILDVQCILDDSDTDRDPCVSNRDYDGAVRYYLSTLVL